MSIRRWAFLVIAAGYFACLLCRTFGVLPSLGQDRNVVANSADALLFCSGAYNTYGYFAPRLPDERCIELQFTDRSGRNWRENVYEGFGSEAHHRVFAVVGCSEAFREEPLQREAFASLAAWALKRHPEALTVRLCIRHRIQPTMSEFRAGSRPYWQDDFQISYHRSDVKGLRVAERE